MSQSIVLIVPAEFEIADFSRKIEKIWRAESTSYDLQDREIQLQKKQEGSNSLSYISLRESLLQAEIKKDYLENDLIDLNVRKFIADKKYLFLSFNETVFCNNFLRVIFLDVLDRQNCRIDTGYGKIISAHDFLTATNLDDKKGFQSY